MEMMIKTLCNYVFGKTYPAIIMGNLLNFDNNNILRIASNNEIECTVTPLETSEKYDIAEEATEYFKKYILEPNTSPRSLRKSKITIEDFNFIKFIGKGHFGKVFLCTEKISNTVCAIKVLSKKHLIDYEQVDHTLSETNVLKRAHHPFLISLKCSFQTENRIYFVMDYIGGGDLYFHLNKVMVFSEKRTLFYVCEIILALIYLHSNDIVYRDLKLENILLNKDGHIKITDFGLCKENVNENNRARTICGTPQYIAPEILKDETYGKEVDWWSLGIVTYEMVCGKLPFYNKNVDMIPLLILNLDVKYPSCIGSKMKCFLGKLLEKDPVRRLGYGPHEAIDIKMEPIFADVNWDDVLEKKVEAPYKPFIENEMDTQYFEESREIKDRNESVTVELTEEENGYFLNFNFDDEC